ncbi:Seven TM Receptor [Caenorhabditis elegans]|uniref:Seven TM Receptor n=1 Tax=Caenorhabditis elegans TaxID=6239 RepID=O45809_CAEEL|nr:Seven TM Receptor [Caenorhabditis elegans]CAB04820.1 Seven TM Receptor [Caenorhabditis elegans]|eukprot:NP_506924.1 Seven TM Receptor [Caenorhabditis elegans]
MEYIRMDELTKLISKVGFLSTTILGMLFVCLTVCFVKRDFGSYRNLLIVFSFLGFLFSASEYMIHPMIHSYNSGFVFFTEPHLSLVSNEIMKIGLVFFCGIYGSTICFISVQFLYRYWALFDAPKLIWFEGWMMSAWLIYSFGIGATWSIGIHYFLENDNFTLNYFENGVYDHYGWKLSAIPSFTFVIYTERGAIRWRNLACTIEMTMIIGLQYSIICFCGRKMSVGMKEKISMLSETSKRLHTQFFKALILQIVVPTILLFFPMIIIIYLPVFNLKFSFPTGILFSAFAIYPSIDIAIILYIVSDYRIAIKLLLKSIKSVLLSSSYFPHELSLPTCTPQTPLPRGTARI